jgi:hypothetical protein
MSNTCSRVAAASASTGYPSLMIHISTTSAVARAPRRARPGAGVEVRLVGRDWRVLKGVPGEWQLLARGIGA